MPSAPEFLNASGYIWIVKILLKSKTKHSAKAYRHIYQSSTSLFNALRRIEADIEPSAVRDEILNFVRSNDFQIVGERESLRD